MKEKKQTFIQTPKKAMGIAVIFYIMFAIWTALIHFVDVQAIGPRDSSVGLATINGAFHQLTGANMTLYNITDWAGLVPLFICFVFAGIGVVQWVKRKRPFKVDADIIVLGVYYVIVIFAYLIFEMIPFNYRPVLINGYLETSYPSSTTLLVMSVMVTTIFQVWHRMKKGTAKNILLVLMTAFSIFMVVGRLISGVHWLSDILGSVFLSTALIMTYIGWATYVRKDW